MGKTTAVSTSRSAKNAKVRAIVVALFTFVSAPKAAARPRPPISHIQAPGVIEAAKST